MVPAVGLMEVVYFKSVQSWPRGCGIECHQDPIPVRTYHSEGGQADGPSLDCQRQEDPIAEWPVLTVRIWAGHS